VEVHLWNNFFLGFDSHELLMIVYVKWWVVIDLQDPSFIVFVQENVDSEDLENFSNCLLLSKGCFDLVLDQATKHLHDALAGVVDTFFDLINVNSFGFKLPEQGSKCSLWPIIWAENVFWFPNIIRRSFINGVVGQVHILIPEVLLGWCLILLRTETSKTFITYESMHGLVFSKTTNNCDVDSQVIFVSLDEHWLVNVSLYDIFCVILAWKLELKFFDISEENDTVTLSASLWFPNEACSSVSFHIRL